MGALAPHIAEGKRIAFGDRVLSLRLTEIGWLLLLNGLLFESYLSQLTTIADYLDEIATLLLALCAGASLLGRQAKSEDAALSGSERAAFGTLFMLVGIVFLGGYISGVQTSLKPIFIDVFACLKFPVALLSGYLVFRNQDAVFFIFVCEAKVLLFIMLPFALANQFSDIGMWFDIRYGLHSFQFIFGHPSKLAAVVVGIIVLLLADERKNNFIWLLLCWVYLLLTLRSTAIGFAFFSFLIWFTSRNQGKVRPGQIIAFLPIVFYFGWTQIQYYFFETDGSARRMLLDVGFQIANRYAPLGSGFATYASNVTGRPEYYSPLYFQYGLSNVHGLTIQNTSFLSDSFWPIVIGQFGWLGLAVYVALLILLCCGCVGRLKSVGASTLTVLTGFSYLFFSSMSSSAFFHPMALFIAATVALSVCHQLSSRSCR